MVFVENGRVVDRRSMMRAGTIADSSVRKARSSSAPTDVVRTVRMSATGTGIVNTAARAGSVR